MNHGEASELWQRLFAIADRMRELESDPINAESGTLTFNQMRVIKQVYFLTGKHPEGVTLKMVAGALAITPAAASEMVDSLVRKDVLRREHSRNDRRAVAITLTERCRERIARSERRFDELTKRFLDSLPPEERAGFAALLCKFCEKVETGL